MYHLGCSFVGIACPPELRNQTKQEAEQGVHARYDCKEGYDDYDNDARRFEYRHKGRPSYPFLLGKGLLKLRAYATKPSGFLVLCFGCVSHSLPLVRVFPRASLFRLFVLGVLLAERAVLAQYESIRVVLLVLNRVVVSMLTFRAFKRNFGSCRFGCHN